MFTAVLFGIASPLKASHILWINLITDSLPALALGMDHNDKEQLMKMPPRGAKEGLFANGGLACTIFYGVLIGGISLAAFLKLPWEMLHQKQSAVRSGTHYGGIFGRSGAGKGADIRIYRTRDVLSCSMRSGIAGCTDVGIFKKRSLIRCW